MRAVPLPALHVAGPSITSPSPPNGLLPHSAEQSLGEVLQALKSLRAGLETGLPKAALIDIIDTVVPPEQPQQMPPPRPQQAAEATEGGRPRKGGRASIVEVGGNSGANGDNGESRPRAEAEGGKETSTRLERDPRWERPKRTAPGSEAGGDGGSRPMSPRGAAAGPTRGQGLLALASSKGLQAGTGMDRSNNTGMGSSQDAEMTAEEREARSRTYAAYRNEAVLVARRRQEQIDDQKHRQRLAAQVRVAGSARGLTIF